MIFHSIDYAVFFVLVVAIYWCLPQRAQTVLLLVASYFFYGYVHPWFLILIASSTTVVDYLSSARHGALAGAASVFMAVSIASNFGMLGFFKYFNFFADNVSSDAGRRRPCKVSAPVLRVILPVGISFYTFQAMSYTVDVFRGRAARALEPARRGGLHSTTVSAPGRRADPARVMPCCRRSRRSGASPLEQARDATLS